MKLSQFVMLLCAAFMVIETARAVECREYLVEEYIARYGFVYCKRCILEGISPVYTCPDGRLCPCQYHCQYSAGSCNSNEDEILNMCVTEFRASSLEESRRVGRE